MTGGIGRGTATAAAKLAALVGLAACAAEAPGGPFVVHDSAGVAVAVSSAPAWAAGAGWRVGDVLAAVGDGPGSDLFDVAGAVRLSDGRMVVADGGAARVRFHDADGAAAASVGGRGDGPGEFRLIQAMGAAGGDSVWVYDFALARLTILTPGGGVARTASLAPPLAAGAAVGRAPDGSFVMAEVWGPGAPGAPLAEGPAREAAVVARYAGDGRLLDTLGAFPGREVLRRLEGGRMTMGTAPFARASSRALLGDDLVVGDQVGHELSVVGAGARLLRRIRWAGPDLRLGEDEVAAWSERQVASAPPDERPSVRRYLAEAPVPPLRPAYGRLLTDEEGFLWVAAYAHPEDDASRWDVLDPEGRWLGPVDVPVRFRPFQIGTSWILGVSRDPLDVERVELRRLMR